MDELAIIHLLENSFPGKEWQYLHGHPTFQKLLKEHNTSHDDFEYLIEVGELLLRQKRDLNLE